MNISHQSLVEDDSEVDSSSFSSEASSGVSTAELCLISLALAEREAKYTRLRTTWEHHSTQLRHEKQFDNKYRMSYESFGVLSKLLERQLWLNPVKACNSVGHSSVPPEIIVANTIHWLSGGSQHDICDTGNYSKPSFFRLTRLKH